MLLTEIFSCGVKLRILAEWRERVTN